MSKDYVYDLETYPNIFTCCIADMRERKIKLFEISDRLDQREEMFKYLRDIYVRKSRMVGFNNIGFDYPVLHYILNNKNCSVKDIYDQAMKIINSMNSDNRWQYIISEKNMFLQQIDLFKIHHFDNKARATSLKMIEYNGRSKNIEDLPFPVGKYLTNSEKDVLIKYNIHDVKETIKFFEQSKTQIEFREKLSSDYGFNALNWNDVKIGKEYFVMELEKAGVKCFNKGKPIQTKRTFIDLDECIFPYVKFERPEFNAILNWLKRQRITETKGVFSDILEHELGEVAKYAKLVIKKEKLKGKPTEEEIDELKQLNPLSWVEEVQLKAKIPKKDGGGFKKAYYNNWNKANSLNVIVDGLEYVYGTGGIHASVESQVVESDNDFIIIDLDVASFYPNLAIKNRIFPEHLSEQFCDIYEYIYNLRRKYKKEGKDAEQQMLKLALNGTYGASNDQFSPFFDPKFTMMITINGQLSLCMAVEKMLHLKDVQIIQCNTDGFTLRLRREDIDECCNIVKEWEEITGLELERNDYSKMIIRDVNNYIAVYDNGKLKSKGAYEWKDLPHHKNQSALVVKMAAEKYLVDNINPEEFIRNHDNKYDFMLRTKVPRSSKLVLVDDDGIDHQTQNICRYYVSEKGMDMIKVMPPITETKEEEVWKNDELLDEVTISSKTDIAKYKKKGYTFSHMVNTPCPDRRFNIESGWKVKVTNDIDNFDWDIDYNYYIERTWKLIDFAIDDEVLEDD